MKKFLVVICLLSFTTKVFAQQFAQYNTGTLYDSFENPAQRSFIPDSSRNMASNFFIPNFNGSFYVTGDAQASLKGRLFTDHYDNSALKIGDGSHLNYVNSNANAYSLMYKLFTSFNGNEEIGFFIKTQGEGSGLFTDESVAIFNGSGPFNDGTYNNIFNSRYRYQLYNQFGLSYREQLSKQFAIGFKLALVSGIREENLVISRSTVTFDKTNDAATIGLEGRYQKSGPMTYNPLRYPGASISIGTLYRTKDGFIIQTNIKDLGFIHWGKFVETDSFSSEQTVTGLTTVDREKNVYKALTAITTANRNISPYNTPIDGRAELSASKTIWLDDDKQITYSPTVIASKELFYNGFTGGLVNPVGYKNYSLSLITSYNDMKLFNLGLQFMIKSPNAEFFIGSDRLAQSANAAGAYVKSQSAINQNGAFSGADLFMGFSMKFGHVIEHPMNSSVIPMGVHGFLGRMWQKIFKTNEVVQDGW